MATVALTLTLLALGFCSGEIGRTAPCMTTKHRCTTGSLGAISIINRNFFCCDAGSSMTFINNRCTCTKTHEAIPCAMGPRACRHATSKSSDNKGNTRCCLDGYTMQLMSAVFDGNVIDRCNCAKYFKGNNFQVLNNGHHVFGNPNSNVFNRPASNVFGKLGSSLFSGSNFFTRPRYSLFNGSDWSAFSRPNSDFWRKLGANWRNASDWSAFRKPNTDFWSKFGSSWRNASDWNAFRKPNSNFWSKLGESWRNASDWNAFSAPSSIVFGDPVYNSTSFNEQIRSWGQSFQNSMRTMNDRLGSRLGNIQHTVHNGMHALNQRIRDFRQNLFGK